MGGGGGRKRGFENFGFFVFFGFFGFFGFVWILAKSQGDWKFYPLSR